MSIELCAASRLPPSLPLLHLPAPTVANLAPCHTIVCVSFQRRQGENGSAEAGGGRGGWRGATVRGAGRANANVPHSWRPVSTHPSILSCACRCLGNQRKQQQSHFISCFFPPRLPDEQMSCKTSLQPPCCV